MRRPPRWSGLPAPPRCFYPGCRPAPACHRSRRPGRRGHGFQVPVQCRGVKEDAPERPASGPGQHGPPYLWPFRTPDAPLSGRSGGFPPEWSTARTEVKALLTISSIELRSSRLRMPERMPVIKRILNCCRWGLPFRARSISSGATSTLSVSGRRETAGIASFPMGQVDTINYLQSNKIIKKANLLL